ncbi:MAG: PD-(D/E)XK nuclease family protein, partial [Deltaproteobacteria bacterium]|nr:PD-(D/E)XK nuclease family protein [Deltaproteobacteria bacterium]
LCPLKDYYRYFLKVPEDLKTKEVDLNTTQKGTLLHEALNLAHHQAQAKSEDLIEAVLAQSGYDASDTLKAELKKQLKDYLQSPAFKNINQAQEILSEFPFILKLKSGQVRGQIDRLILKDDHWLLVDFKFTQKHAGLKEIKAAYDFQLKTYSLAAWRAFAKKPKVEVHLLAQTKVVALDYSEAELETHQKLLEKIQNQKNQQKAMPEVEFRKHCYECAYARELSLCPVGLSRLS